jgi:hypothetical protein
MANKRITDYDDGVALQDADYVVIARAGANYKLSGAELIAAVMARRVAETPTGTIDGVNAVFHLTHMPTPLSSLDWFKNGIKQRVGTDITVVASGGGADVTYVVGNIPQPAAGGYVGDNHEAKYWY